MNDLRIIRLITRAQEIMQTAPNASADDFDNNDHPKTPEFHISKRMVKFDYDAVSILPIDNIIEITEDTGMVAVTGRADISMEQALARMESLREQAIANTDTDKTGWAGTEALRGIEIGGHPAAVRIELVQQLGANAVRTSYVRFDLHRYLPDDSTLMQSGYVGVRPFHLGNHDSVLYDSRGSAVYNPEHSARLNDEQARLAASAQLPYDHRFPLDQPIDIDQVKLMLG